MPDKRVALVTGANKGIGLEIARQLAGKGLTVLVGSRDVANGEEAAKGIEGDAHAIQLDVTDEASVAAAAERIRSEFGRLDVLVNNAGISNAGKSGVPFADLIEADSLVRAPMEAVRKVWDTNVFGIITVTQAMLPLLRRSSDARIVTTGSVGGSIAWNSDPENPHRKMYGNYSSSKTASHAVTMAFAFALENEGIRVNIADPGHTATALNNFSGPRSVGEGALRAVQLATEENVPTATFSGDSGPVAW